MRLIQSDFHFATRLPTFNAVTRLEGATAVNTENGASTTFQRISDPVLEVQLKRLREERDCLLTSGVYYEDDELIIDLDREIKRLQNVTSNATA